MSHQFNPTILREYDIRGIVGETLTEADAYALGRSFAALALDEGAKTLAVGRDGRTHSGALEAELIRGLTEGGIDVVLIGMGPSPMLYFATHFLDVQGGIQVTGSHNPADYNGFKLLLKGRSVFGEEIQALGARSAAGEWSEGKGTVEEVDIREAYADRLLEGFSGKPFRIGWEAGNRAARAPRDLGPFVGTTDPNASPVPTRTPVAGSHDLCIYVGPSGAGELNFYTDVSTAGLRARADGPVLEP